MSEALYRNQWLHLDYRNASGKRAKVDVMPLGLVQQGARLYLVCRYRGYDNERNLALHRIVSADLSAIGFDRPKEFDLKRYDDDGRFAVGDGWRIRLSFRTTQWLAGFLSESPLSFDQTIRAIGSEFEVTASVVDSALLDSWLLGFGVDVHSVEKSPLRVTDGRYGNSSSKVNNR